jgi:hypothetical protein
MVNYHIRWRYIPEAGSLHNHGSENLRTNMFIMDIYICIIPYAYIQQIVLLWSRELLTIWLNA